MGATYRLGPELEITGYSCEDHFFEQNHRWYRCRNKGVDRRSGRMKCRAKASAGRVTCDMPVRADAHLLAADACV